MPKEICQRAEQDDKEQGISDETILKDDKIKKTSRKKSLTTKKGNAFISLNEMKTIAKFALKSIESRVKLQQIMSMIRLTGL